MYHCVVRMNIANVKRYHTRSYGEKNANTIVNMLIDITGYFSRGPRKRTKVNINYKG